MHYVGIILITKATKLQVLENIKKEINVKTKLVLQQIILLAPFVEFIYVLFCKLTVSSVTI